MTDTLVETAAWAESDPLQREINLNTSLLMDLEYDPKDPTLSPEIKTIFSEGRAHYQGILRVLLAQQQEVQSGLARTALTQAR